ncbi:MAG TPA: hypothetical protein VJ642_11915 [Chromobacteriaceae bacterium]|nr:hypothetical protein [Chromobacteriaceae bacterium]
MKRKLIAIAVFALASTGAFAGTTSSYSEAGGTAAAQSVGTAAAFATSSQAAMSSPFVTATSVTAKQTAVTFGTGDAMAVSGGTAFATFTKPSWFH